MSTTPFRYTAELAHDIERTWQDRWDEQGTYCAPNPSGPWGDPEAVAGREKMLVLDMFPFPSGVGLHVGHPLGYIATDVFARYHRMCGKNVLHTMGYDAFGLPAEQYAVQTGQHPRKTTEENIATMARQLRMLGLGHDPRRAIRTIDPEYYRWTQWIFLKLYDAWYDDAQAKARPIAELVAAYESGERPTPSGAPWGELSDAERRAAVDGERLAYLSSAPVNWCPGLGTVLANEEVTADGRSERGNYPVFRRNLRQWMMRITRYADRLAADLDRVDWPEKVKAMQRNWIGRSEGARVFFDAAGERLEVFTTRPDTLFGAMFMVVAPEHPLVGHLTADAWPEGTRRAWTGGAASPAEAVKAYQLATSRKSELDRQTEGKDKTGVFTGTFATNPVDGRKIPVFVADYVLMGYGTGAIMAVPAEDERDWDFAKAYDIDIVRTVAPPEGWGDEPWTGDGVKINSAGDGIDLNGMSKDEAKAAMAAHIKERGYGEATVTYRLRDWLFSRQRYWGEPFPIVYDRDGVPHALPESMLPLELPEVDDYSPMSFDPEDADSQPSPPLSRATEWTTVTLDLGDGEQEYTRETNTMPNWAGSCWYYLRYLDPANDDAMVDPGVEEYWMGRQAQPVPGAPEGAQDPGGVDLYVGGVEHAVLHLLYARFWHKALFDLGYLSSEEPFRRYFSQGYIQGYVYRDHRGQPVEAKEVLETLADDGTPTWTYHGETVTREIGKIGKSLKNGVSPDEVVEQYGADTFRVYEMAMGPLELSKPWETKAVVGSQRFLQRLWRLAVDEETGELRVVDDPLDDAHRRILHRTIEAVRHDYATLGFNTAVARLIELVNALTKLERAPREGVETLVRLVSPLAPHLAEELWHRLGHDDSVVFADFPEADPAYLVDETVTCVVQVQGKVKARLEVAADISGPDLEELALANDRVQAALAGKTVRKVISKPPTLVNIVAG